MERKRSRPQNRPQLVHWSEVQVLDFNLPSPERKAYVAHIETEYGTRQIRAVCHGADYFRALGFTVVKLELAS